MIARLSGKLIAFDASTLLVDIAGVAYEVDVSAAVLQNLPGLGGDVVLHTHFVVREDAQLLYGFAAKSERDLFRAFIKINGVGPKLGLALISSLDPASLGAALRNNDVSLLTKVPGVGKKTAERLMVELKSRLDALTESGVVPMVNGDALIPRRGAGLSAIAMEAEGALVALGYRGPEAARAVGAALTQADDTQMTPEALVRLALRGFAKVT